MWPKVPFPGMVPRGHDQFLQCPHIKCKPICRCGNHGKYLWAMMVGSHKASEMRHDPSCTWRQGGGIHLRRGRWNPDVKQLSGQKFGEVLGHPELHCAFSPPLLCWRSERAWYQLGARQSQSFQGMANRVSTGISLFFPPFKKEMAGRSTATAGAGRVNTCPLMEVRQEIGKPRNM